MRNESDIVGLLFFTCLLLHFNVLEASTSVPATYTGHIQFARSVTPTVLTLDMNKILLILLKFLEEFFYIIWAAKEYFSTAALLCVH